LKNILITRSKKRSKKLNDFLSQNDYKIFNEKLFNVIKYDTEDIQSNLINKNSAIIITSQYAVDSLDNLGLSKNILIFAVGKFSCEKLIDLGYNNIKIAHNYSAKSLFDLIIKTKDIETNLPIYYFRGEQISFDFKSRLQEFDLRVIDIICYKTYPKKTFSEDFLQFAKTQKFDEVLLYSKNSAIIFLNLLQMHNMLEYFKDSKILCFSDEIADFIKNKKSLKFSKIENFFNSQLLKKFYD